MIIHDRACVHRRPGIRNVNALIARKIGGCDIMSVGNFVYYRTYIAVVWKVELRLMFRGLSAFVNFYELGDKR